MMKVYSYAMCKKKGGKGMSAKKVKEINEKEVILVKGQKNCQLVHKPKAYTSGDCLNDCSTEGMPSYYVSSYY